MLIDHARKFYVVARFNAPADTPAVAIDNYDLSMLAKLFDRHNLVFLEAWCLDSRSPRLAVVLIQIISSFLYYKGNSQK